LSNGSTNWLRSDRPFPSLNPRTEEEGIWTKQIPKDSGWQPAADAERLFKQIANEMRADKGLGAVLSL